MPMRIIERRAQLEESSFQTHCGRRVSSPSTILAMQRGQTGDGQRTWRMRLWLCYVMGSDVPNSKP